MTSEALVRAGRRTLAVSVFAGAFVGLGRCGGYEPGIEVELALQAAPATSAFDTDLGFRIRLEEAMLMIDSLELVRCSPVARRAPSRADPHSGPGPGPRWSQLTIAKAWAHVDEHPTATGAVPRLNAMHSTGAPVEAGILRPPPGRYCALRVTPPPDSAVLHVRGTAVDVDSEHAFDIEAPTDQSIEIPLTEALVLSATKRSAGLVIVIDQHRWLDGIDFDQTDEIDRARQAVDNALGALLVRRI